MKTTLGELFDKPVDGYEVYYVYGQDGFLKDYAVQMIARKLGRKCLHADPPDVFPGLFPAKKQCTLFVVDTKYTGATREPLAMVSINKLGKSLKDKKVLEVSCYGLTEPQLRRFVQDAAMSVGLEIRDGLEDFFMGVGVDPETILDVVKLVSWSYSSVGLADIEVIASMLGGVPGTSVMAVLNQLTAGNLKEFIRQLDVQHIDLQELLWVLSAYVLKTVDSTNNWYSKQQLNKLVPLIDRYRLDTWVLGMTSLVKQQRVSDEFIRMSLKYRLGGYMERDNNGG
jgi:hypothetical protein